MCFRVYEESEGISVRRNVVVSSGVLKKEVFAEFSKTDGKGICLSLASLETKQNHEKRQLKALGRVRH